MLLMFIGVVVGFLVALALAAPRKRRAVEAAKRSTREAIYAEDKHLYERRWQSAVELLGAEGALSPEQIKEITAPTPIVQVLPPAVAEDGSYSLSLLHSMYSEDRRDLEVERAKNGLPRVDDLEGMFSEDVSAVLRAHAKKPPLS